MISIWFSDVIHVKWTQPCIHISVGGLETDFVWSRSWSWTRNSMTRSWSRTRPLKTWGLGTRPSRDRLLCQYYEKEFLLENLRLWSLIFFFLFTYLDRNCPNCSSWVEFIHRNFQWKIRYSDALCLSSHDKIHGNSWYLVLQVGWYAMSRAIRWILINSPVRYVQTAQVYSNTARGLCQEPSCCIPVHDVR